MDEPRLRHTSPAGPVRAAILVLHGGREHSNEPVGATNLSYRLMAWLARGLASHFGRSGVAVWLLRHRIRGWNASSNGVPPPVADARRAIEEIRAAHPTAPLVLVGHSMGGRTACAVADEPGVVGVCALAPWLPEGEPIEQVKGRPLFVIHGTADTWTSPRLSRVYVERLVAHGSPAQWLPVDGAGHFLVKRVGTWRRLTHSAVAALLP
jgi:pimeloyl-ACP methyl ester carboxylesterase